ncbi:MAG TPA: riboflavin synthase [Chitinophagaceae bacterium]|nr:riboflavin synthase [Chitinophagaceae bacterium]HNE93697.1 riboflavin synthase [Chitinophagaceae bacterium]HNM34166.1 riboflavin synthase [Chitinophagaceae bacterium]HNN30434.1 riboflavin synthase [Chitinophagaceae bacterium]
MFTGIIETTGVIKQIIKQNSNLTFVIETKFTNELKVDQSIAHNGICLTVEKVENNLHTVTAIEETINKTTIASWKIDDIINIERCLKVNSRIDGHFVQGHVDTTAVCCEKLDINGSCTFTFSIAEKFANLIIEKGSICVNGISLTCFNVTKNSFTVAIIPYTFTNTNMHSITVGNYVNIEFDVLGKYINRAKELGS